MVKVNYKTGDKVFAKVKGYPPWPARIEGENGKKYNVLFYGTKETGAIKPEDICYYSKNKANYVHKYLRRYGYESAVKQIEEAIKKDGGDGNDNVTGDESANDIDVSDTSSVSSASDKKTPKRRGASLPDEPIQKKATGRLRRKSTATTDSKEDLSDEPAPKKARRTSNTSTDNDSKADSEEQTSKKPSDNGVKATIAEEDGQDEKDEDIQKVEEKAESETAQIEDVKDKKFKRSGESSDNFTESETDKGEETESAMDSEAAEKAENKEVLPKKPKTDGEAKKPKE